MSSDTLRFDRYLARAGTLVDLATGAVVHCQWRRGRDSAPLFTVRRDRVLIDVESRARGRFEIWERRWADACDERHLEVQRAFVEMLDNGRYGAPRAFQVEDVPPAQTALLVRQLARQARCRGWVPIAASQLATLDHRAPAGWSRWLDARSLVVFIDRSGARPTIRAALSHLAARDARPHLLVDGVVIGEGLDRHAAPNDDFVPVVDPHGRPGARSAPRETGRSAGRCQRIDDEGWGRASGGSDLVHELHARYGASCTVDRDATEEARARWTVMLANLLGSPVLREKPVIELAWVLMHSGQTFEARALLGVACAKREMERERCSLVAQANQASRIAAATALGIDRISPDRRYDMVDDFVGVLQLCQDTEDERVALSRVGAFVRERLQASTVAFVVREGPGARAVASAGLDQAQLDAALTAIESGCAVAARVESGPTESAAPVRYAADVIGALWARWSAGVPVSRQDASALLGVAAVAAAPSLRGVLDRERPRVDAAVPELVGDSSQMRTVRDAIVRAARSPFPVLIEGESGVGKELAARAIHAAGARRDRCFSAVNCAALVDDLVEAELFGHARGAFTGAHADRRGLFEEASGGTLLLDEVAELGSRVQAKLLRTLQEGEVRRLGESHTRRVDVRVVAATNRPLAVEVDRGRFRRDLWYRLDVIRITIPPVRERLEDLPLLVRHAWSDLAARTGSRAVLSASAVSALAAYDWPGNVRELQNVLASILVSAPRRGLLGPSLLPAHIARAAALTPAGTLDAARRQFETRFVRAALARANGRTAVAARELGLSRQGLAKILARLGLSAAGGAHEAHVE